jgi:hypothetical protein
MIDEGLATVGTARSSSARATTDLRARLERALAADSPAVGRLSYTKTSVTIQLEEECDGVTPLLDRQPPQLVELEPAEIEIRLTARQAHLFSRGALIMPDALVAGEVNASGPVRRYLRKP